MYLSNSAITILGQPPSKSNSYRVITIRGHGSLGKTPALRRYEEQFYLQCPLRGSKRNKRFKLVIDVYFSSDRPDLDNALKVVLDCLQTCKAITNDRLCCAIDARKLIDKEKPRIEFVLLDE